MHGSLTPNSNRAKGAPKFLNLQGGVGSFYRLEVGYISQICIRMANPFLEVGEWDENEVGLGPITKISETCKLLLRSWLSIYIQWLSYFKNWELHNEEENEGNWFIWSIHKNDNIHVVN